MKRVLYVLFVLIVAVAASVAGAAAGGMAVYRAVQNRSSLPAPLQGRAIAGGFRICLGRTGRRRRVRIGRLRLAGLTPLERRALLIALRARPVAARRRRARISHRDQAIFDRRELRRIEQIFATIRETSDQRIDLFDAITDDRVSAEDLRHRPRFLLLFGL